MGSFISKCLTGSKKKTDCYKVKVRKDGQRYAKGVIRFYGDSVVFIPKRGIIEEGHVAWSLKVIRQYAFMDRGFAFQIGKHTLPDGEVVWELHGEKELADAMANFFQCQNTFHSKDNCSQLPILPDVNFFPNPYYKCMTPVVACRKVDTPTSQTCMNSDGNSKTTDLSFQWKPFAVDYSTAPVPTPIPAFYMETDPAKAYLDHLAKELEKQRKH